VDDLLWLRPPLCGLTFAPLTLAFAAIGRLRRQIVVPQVGHQLGKLFKAKGPRERAFGFKGCLTMTYFRMGNPHYHRRAAVSRSCSGWEGVVPTGCGRQALNVQGSGISSQAIERCMKLKAIADAEEVKVVRLSQTP
jgi:hypothetical protein